jgi:hypothetical protein
MTPQEKAVQLVQRFIDEAYAETTEQLYTPVAKNAALIAVDEILDVDCCDMSEEYFDNHIEYWKQVKTEIQNL